VLGGDTVAVDSMEDIVDIVVDSRVGVDHPDMAHHNLGVDNHTVAAVG
jgi:hypothetical protein